MTTPQLSDVLSHKLEEIARGRNLSLEALLTDWAESNAGQPEKISLLHEALQASTVSVMLVDAQPPELSIIYVNPAFEALTGYTAEETLGHNPHFLKSQEPDQSAYELVREAIRTGKPCRATLRNYRKDGTLFWNDLQISPIHDSDGRLKYFIGVQHDVTQVKEAELQLAYQANLLENISDAIIATDPEFIIQSWNKAAEVTYGWRADEVIGKNAREILRSNVPLSEVEQSVQEFKHLGYWGGVVVQTRKDGSRAFILSSVTALKNAHGDVIGAVAVNRDITQEKRFQEKLAQNERELARLYEEVRIYANELERLVEERTAELTRTRDRVEAILNNNIDGIVLANNEGMIQQTNPAFDELFGCEVDEKFGQSILSLVENESQGKLKESLELVRLTGKPQQLELLARRTDGTVLDVALALYRITSQPIDGIGCNFRDITRRKRAEEALRRSEADLRAVLDSTNISFTLIDLDYRIRSANKLAVTRSTLIFGKEMVQGDSIYNFMPENDRAGFSQLFQRVLKQESIRVERAFPTSAGEMLFFEVRFNPVTTNDGQIIGVCMTTEDITARKLAEKALRKQEHFLRQIIDLNPNLVFVKDKEGRFTLANKALTEYYGTTPEGIVGKKDADFISNPQEIEAFSYADREVLRQGKALSVTEETLTLGNGSVLWLETAKIPLLDENGTPDKVLGVAVDITGRKEAEIALLDALIKEKELHEMKSSFVSMISHEFRTPLTAIQLSVDTLESYLDKLDNTKRAKRFQSIHQQIKRMNELLEDVLTLSRAEAGALIFEPQGLDLDQLCRDMVEDFQYSLGTDHHLHFSSSGSTGKPFQGDEKLLHQMMSNLLSNAIKYSPAGSHVQVELHHEPAQVSLSVKDAGIGIPADDQEKLFTAFHRANNVGTIQGTGLGLIVTKQAVELHCGSITFQSKEGAGTTFTVTLPVKST